MPASWPVVPSHRRRVCGQRDEGRWGVWARCGGKRIIDPWLAKIEEWVERSCPQDPRRSLLCQAEGVGVRGFGPHGAPSSGGGQEELRGGSAAGNCIGRGSPSPMWAQWDWGAGPVIAGRRTNLFCAWLAWSRFRVVIATWDRTLPTVIACVDRAMRRLPAVHRRIGSPTTSARSRSTTSLGSLCAIRRWSRSAATTGSRWRRVCRRTLNPKAAARRRCGRQGRLGAHRREPARRLHQLGRVVEAVRRSPAEVNARVHRVTRRPTGGDAH